MNLVEWLTTLIALAALGFSGYGLQRQLWSEGRQRAAHSGRIVTRLFRLGNDLLEFARWLERLDAEKHTSIPYTLAIAKRILEESDSVGADLRRIADDAASAHPGVMAYMEVAINGVADVNTFARSIAAQPPDVQAIPGYRSQLHDRLVKSAGALISAHTLMLKTDPDLSRDQREYHQLVASATEHVIRAFPSSERVLPPDAK